MQKLDKLELHLLAFPTESDETPTTAISTLPHIPTPLPPAVSGSCCIVGVDSWDKQEDMEEAVPKAPLVRDLDSFTEGTGKGSFDSILDDYPQEQGDLFCHPNSLELLHTRDDTMPLSIETWREQVSGHAPEPYEDPVEGTHRFILARDADAVIDLGPDDLADYRYEPRSPIPPPTAPSDSLRVTKRSRSRSPEPSRRIRFRPRSQSLSSLKSFTSHIIDGLSSAPPWRAKNLIDMPMPPFD